MGIHVTILAGKVGTGVGSHVYHQELTRRLAARGHDVSLVCFASGPELSETVKVYQIPCADYTSTTFFWRLASPFQYRHITREFMRLDIPPANIVIGGEHLFLRAYHRRFPQTPLIYVPHAPVAPQEIQHYGMPPSMCWITKQLYSYLQQWALIHADRTLRFTHVACQMLTAYYGSSISARFVVNPVGFDLPELSGVKSVKQEIRFLSVGRLLPWKRIDLALTALAKLQNYRWRFDIVGEGGARPALEQQTRQLGLENRVRFHGFQPDLTPWYEQADFFLFPSACEGLGFVMLEAMSHGVPCLAIKANRIDSWNASAEVVDHGMTGLLATDEADFGRQLESVLRDPQQLLPLGIAARDHVKEHYAWDKHLDYYEALFDELTIERRGARGVSKSPKDKLSLPVERKNAAETPPMSFHHVLVSRELGGAGITALRLAKALNDRTGGCHIWIPGDGPARRGAEALGLTSFLYDSTHMFSSSKLHTGAINWKFCRTFRSYRPGIVHVHSPLYYGALQLGLKLSGFKRVVHVQLEEDLAGLRWALRNPPDVIITCAKYLVDYVRQCLPEAYAERQRIVAVPNAVDIDRFFPGDKSEAKRRVGAAAGVPLILVVANLAPHKGQETAIKTVAELKNRGVDVACWLAGSERGDGVVYTDRLRSLTSELGLADRVRLLGFRSDTNDLLRAADFLLLPSSQEGLPICVLEAQASKVPVLAAPTAGIPEVVADGKTGFLIPAHDYVSYSNAVQMLLSHRRLYDEISENAYHQIRREYEWKVYCERMWELYCDLLG
jgi:glycosyltransferase involved in cell wall biosynthesis